MRSIVMLALVFACVILLTSSGAQASSHATRAVELAEAPAPVPSSAASPSTASAPGPIPIVLPKESTLAISPVEKEALDDLRARVSAACRAMDFTVADVPPPCMEEKNTTVLCGSSTVPGCIDIIDQRIFRGVFAGLPAGKRIYCSTLIAFHRSFTGSSTGEMDCYTKMLPAFQEANANIPGLMECYSDKSGEETEQNMLNKIPCIKDE